AAVDRLLDKIVERERLFLDSIRTRTPLIETYIQESAEAAPNDPRPVKDHYFLGRFRLGESLAYETLVERTDTPAPQKSGGLFRLFNLSDSSRKRGMTFLARGFAQMTAIDLSSFDRRTYRFDYVRREFLGEVR